MQAAARQAAAAAAARGQQPASAQASNSEGAVPKGGSFTVFGRTPLQWGWLAAGFIGMATFLRSLLS